MTGTHDGVALVTGASSGIGRATAKRFAEEGAQVVVVDVDVDGGRETVADIEAAGGEATFVEADITDEADVEEMVAAAVDSYGGLDYAFNNAGVEGTEASASEQPISNWEQVIDTNLKGVFMSMREEIPVLLENGGGAIVNTASVAGLRGFRNLSPYVASKHGVLGLTKTAAAEFRSREANPETMEATIAATPANRLGQPEEIAAAATWLCSDDASFVTGESLVVDGGFTVG
jgi:NAD(P)-dependent dehydrogenase (short-subunit alcohol dehydrogenase family)